MHMLRHTLVLSVPLTLAALAAPTRAAEPDKFLPDDSSIVISVNVQQILDSPLVKKHALDWLRNFVREKSETQKTLEALGFDPFKDLQNITVAMPSIADAERALCIGHGRFDVEKFRRVAADVARQKPEHLKIQRTGEITIYEIRDGTIGDDKPVFAALVDGSTVVACGAKQPILDALAKASGSKTGTLKKDVRQLITKADAGQSIWVVAAGPALATGDLTGDEKTKRSLEQIEAVTAGVTVTDGFKVEVVAVTKTPEAAKELSEQVADGLNQARGLLAILVGNNGKLSGLVEALGSIRNTATGTTVTLSLEVPGAVIEKMLKSE
jgi:hypothetical protein